MVAHNGDRFDLPWFKTRCILHGIPTHPRYKTIDTLAWAKRNFYFNTNKMDYIGKFLGFGGKIETGLELWKDVVLKNDREKLDQMAEYCRRDVQLLEQVYKKMAAHITHKTHVGVMKGGDKWQCPHCGSMDVISRRKNVTAGGTRHWDMQCTKDGRIYKISDPAHTKWREYRKNLK